MSESLAADFATVLVDQLAAGGLTHVVVCPGSRSAPLAMAAARHPALVTWVHVDERSASFFALGLAKQLESPVALICTSGTAAAEFHAAVVEAYHSQAPLLVMTADRPPELHDVGAPQTIDQSTLYGSAVRWSFDPGPPELIDGHTRHWRRLAVRVMAESIGPPAGPVHLNLPFREPLVRATVEAQAPAEVSAVPAITARRQADRESISRLGEALVRAERPVIVAGEMRRGEELAGAVAAILSRTGAVLLAEPTSQLRTTGLEAQVENYDLLLRAPRPDGLRSPDLVLRLGAPPTSKDLNRFLAESEARVILVDPDRTMRDPDATATDILQAEPAALLAGVAAELGGSPMTGSWRQSWTAAAAIVRNAVEDALQSLPIFEAHAVRALSGSVDSGTLWVGSSMPIRDVDAFWPASEKGPRFLANRGASGIDGFVSSIMGGAASGEATVGLLGDLTLFHDLNGLWAARRHQLDVKLVLLDNNGGGIFSFLPQAAHQDVFEELFGTPLDFDLVGAAQLHGMRTLEVNRADQLVPAMTDLLATPGPALLRVAFSRGQSTSGHRACWQAVSDALA